MHGFIFSEIKGFVTDNLGSDAWLEILKQAGLASAGYVNFREYPDSEAVALVSAASKVTGTPAGDLLEQFGTYLGGDLLKVFKPLVDPTWRTIEFLANTEGVIHRVVRSRNRQAKPPELAFTRSGPDEVILMYNSPRKLCALARGIALGVAGHYGERLEVHEEECVHRGDSSCRIRFVRV